MLRSFRQVDVFTDTPYRGNPLAVVLDGSALDTETMQRFAHWTNLSETTFLLPPTDTAADYRVRIFTPVAELPFAGHPTLGTCHTWLEAGGVPKRSDTIVQECGAGLISVRRIGERLAFASPPLIRSGPVEEPLVRHIAAVLNIERAGILDAQWVDNGPGWVAALLGSAKEVLALRPGLVDIELGVVGPYPAGSRSRGGAASERRSDGEPQELSEPPAEPSSPSFEVRAFFPKDGSTVEDPVTGSLNASLAEWLLASGRAHAPYVVSQGTALGRAGRVHVSGDDEGTIWIGGQTITCVTGQVELLSAVPCDDCEPGPHSGGSVVTSGPRRRVPPPERRQWTGRATDPAAEPAAEARRAAAKPASLARCRGARQSGTGRSRPRWSVSAPFVHDVGEWFAGEEAANIFADDFVCSGSILRSYSAIMRKDDHIGRAPQGMIRRKRFGVGDIQSSTLYRAIPQCLNKCVLVNYGSASNVVDIGRFLHGLEFGLGDHMSCFCCQR